MNIVCTKNIVINFVKKHKVAVLISLVVIAIAYNDNDFKKRAVDRPITEYLTIDELMKFYGGDILEYFSKSALIRSICSTLSCPGDGKK